jgi:hypothetical protein
MDVMPRVTCPACGKGGSVPVIPPGRRIRCPACGERFAPAESRSMVVVERRAMEADEPPLELTELTYLGPAEAPAPAMPPPVFVAVTVPPALAPAPPETRPCPFCGEPILAIAKKCKHCGEMLDPALRAAAEAMRYAERPAERPVMPPPPVYAPPQQILQQRIVVRTGGGYRVPHLLHLLLTLLTFGLWLPIWIIHALLNMGNDRD